MNEPEMNELSSDQLGEFRRTYIRDDWDGTTGLSRYNQANKKRFFEDDDLRLTEQRIRSDKAEELDALWTDKKDERIKQGDSEEKAGQEATKTQNEARLRLLRADCLRVLRIDPAYRASLIVGDKASLADKLLETWANQIEEDESWVTSRAGEYASIPLERM